MYKPRTEKPNLGRIPLLPRAAALVFFLGGIMSAGNVGSIAPISITGDTDLTPPGSSSGCQCARLTGGVWVIGPWSISGSPGDGVYIANVTQPFVLLNMTIAKSAGAGIHLKKIDFAATPMTVVSGVGTSIQNNQVGILVENSSGVILNGGGASPNGPGIASTGAGTINKNFLGAIDVENSSSVTVRGWQMSANGQDGRPDWIGLDPGLAYWGVGGVRFFNVNHSTIDHNSANNDTSISYSLFGSSYNTVTSNTGDYPFTANLMLADGSSNNKVDGNVFGTADFIGVLVADPLDPPPGYVPTQQNTIQNNVVHSSGPTGAEIKAGVAPSFGGGIVLLNGTTLNTITGNQLSANTGNDMKWAQAVKDGSSPIGVSHLPTPSVCVTPSFGPSNGNTWSGNIFKTQDVCPSTGPLQP